MTAASDRRKEAARQLRNIKKTTKQLCRLYPELATTFNIKERRYLRSIAAAIMVADEAGERDGT
jgi:hypothetical protein